MLGKWIFSKWILGQGLGREFFPTAVPVHRADVLEKDWGCSCSSQILKGATGYPCAECFPHRWKYDVPWTESQSPEGAPGNEAIPVILSGVCTAMMFVEQPVLLCSDVIRWGAEQGHGEGFKARLQTALWPEKVQVKQRFKVALCADSVVSRGKENLLLLKDHAHKSMFGWKFDCLGIDNKGKTLYFFLELFNPFLALLFLRDTG